MSDDEKKAPRISLAASSAAVLAAIFGAVDRQTVTALGLLQPVPGRYSFLGRSGGSLAHQRWKRRRAAGWHR